VYFGGLGKTIECASTPVQYSILWHDRSKIKYELEEDGTGGPHDPHLNSEKNISKKQKKTVYRNVLMTLRARHTARHHDTDSVVAVLYSKKIMR
jgi:hypothetical protein